MTGMSKLSDRIRKTRRATPKPIGFTAAAAGSPEPTMLTIVRLRSGDVGKISEAAANGADVVIVEGPDAGKFKAQVEKSDAVCGAVADAADRTAVAALTESGADFVVVDLESGLAEALLEDKLGYVLSVELDTEDTVLRLVGDLSLDAVIVPASEGKLSLRSALQLRRVATLARSPLLTEVDPSVGASELEALRGAGAAGVIVEGSAIGKLAKLRKTIASLPERKTRRDDRQEAWLPIGVAAGTTEDHDDDDDDDEFADRLRATITLT